MALSGSVFTFGPSKRRLSVVVNVLLYVADEAISCDVSLASGFHDSLRHNFKLKLLHLIVRILVVKSSEIGQQASKWRPFNRSCFFIVPRLGILTACINRN
jgi:hypothetical protein